MKSTSLLLWCFISLLCIRCAHLDTSEIQKTDTTSKISTREIEDCDECPVDDCCCSVELEGNTTAATLRFCGTSDGTGTCSGGPVGTCPTFSGGGQSISLTSILPRSGFCMNQASGFYVQNITGGSIEISITCQYDITNPQTVFLTLANNVIAYLETDGSCIVSECQ